MARKGWEALQKGVGGVGRPSRRDGMGRQALVEVWEWSGGPPGELGSIGRPIRGDVRAQEDLSEGLEGSVGPSEGPGQVGEPGEFGRHSRKDQEWSAVTPGEPGDIERPSQRARMGQEAILEGLYDREGQEGSVGPPGGPRGVGKPPEWPGGIGRPARRSVRGQESLLGGPGGVWRPFLWDGRGRKGRGVGRPSVKVQEGLGGTPGSLGGTPRKLGGVAGSFRRDGRVR